MKRNLRFIFSILMFAALVVPLSCAEDESRPTFPLSAEIFQSAVGKKVAFTALTHSATSWHWDFGDGQTSTEKNPVHEYAEGGYYLATLTASDGRGNQVTKEVTLALELTPESMLVGDHTKEGYTGKTWKLTADHSSGGDYFAEAKTGLPEVGGTPKPLPTGIFDLEFAMGDIYKDTYTFHHDGSYKHDVKEDGAAFSGYVYSLVNGKDVVNDNGADYGLCIAKYTPESDATFTFNENDNLTVTTVYGDLTFNNVMTLDFSGTEFIGFQDFHRKVVVTSITNTRMQVIMFMAAAPAALPKPTHALILSFEAVN
jgi:PKD repeat protein